ncbi:hypothetical protein ACFL6C_10105 [Myxococcota bacterium]
MQLRLTQGTPVFLEGLPPLGLAYLLAHQELDNPLVVVVANGERAEQTVADLRALGTADVQVFLGDPHAPFEEVSPDPQWVFGRLCVRHRILTGDRPRVIVASAPATQGRWLPDEAFLAATDLWVQGEEIGRDRLAAQLIGCGYQRVNLVEDEGTFAIRGGIVDVFPPGREHPVRLDLFGDEIASIKTFDPHTQRAFDSQEALAIHPIREVLFADASVQCALSRLEQIAEETIIPSRRLHALMSEIEQRNYFFGVEAIWPAFYEQGVPILDTLIADDVMTVIDDRDAVGDALQDRWERAYRERERALDRHRVTVRVEEHLEEPGRTLAAIENQTVLVSVRLSVGQGERLLPVRLKDWHRLAQEMESRREDAWKRTAPTRSSTTLS